MKESHKGELNTTFYYLPILPIAFSVSRIFGFEGKVVVGRVYAIHILWFAFGITLR